MKTILSFFVIITSNLTIAQTTAIPDARFEQRLIDVGLDSGIPDGSIPTANIVTVTSLTVNPNFFSSQISDLTGIEDFSALTRLYCSNSQLTSLDVTQNTALRTLYCERNKLTSLDLTQNTRLYDLDCGKNKLTSLDVTQNPGLYRFFCSDNQLTSLDVTQNPGLYYLTCSRNRLTSLNLTQNPTLQSLFCNDNQLTSLDVTQNPILLNFGCSNNQLTSLDVTQNPSLYDFYCSSTQLTSLDLTQNPSLHHLSCNDNQLTGLDVSQNSALAAFQCRDNQLNCLNVKNGNNNNFTNFHATSNANLTCIEVDNVTYSITNWTNIDAGSSFSTNCNNPCAVGIEENSLINLLIYPNPTSTQLTIDTELNINEMNIIDITGKIIMTIKQNTNIINTTELSNGIYFIQLMTDKKTITKKFVKQ